MQAKNNELKKKAATYSISKMTEERIDLIESEVLNSAVVAESLEEIFQTIYLEIFKEWQKEKYDKLVTRIGSLKFSPMDSDGLMKVVENGLGGKGNPFCKLIEMLELEIEDIKIFVMECRNIVKKNKLQPHAKYEKKQKTYTLYEKTEALLSKFQMILGENKSTSFQFTVLLYSYLKLPSVRYLKAKMLLDSYRIRFEKLSQLDQLAKETAELFMDSKESKLVPLENAVRNQIDLDAIYEEVSFNWYVLLFRIESLELTLSQIDNVD